MRLLLIGLALIAAPAQSEVKSASDHGFLISIKAVSPAPPTKTYERLTHPELWWTSAHTWSGDAANLSLEARAGGCFCERWAAAQVEHGRVIFAKPGTMLRLDAPLGPMQGMGVAAALTFQLAPHKDGTEISLTYNVGGHFGEDPRKLAPGVDYVLKSQLESLVASLRK